MNCLRCGTQIAENAMFCENCKKTVSEPLQETAYLNTQIILPVRKPQPQQTKATRKAERKPEEKKPVGKGLLVFVSVLCVLLLAASLFAAKLFLDGRSRIADLQEQVAALKKTNTNLQRAVDFTDANAAFVPDDGTNLYHTGDCAYFNKNGKFMVYKMETAIARGYDPCPHCQPAK